MIQHWPTLLVTACLVGLLWWVLGCNDGMECEKIGDEGGIHCWTKEDRT